MLHHCRAQTMPLGRPMRPVPSPSPEGVNLMAHPIVDLSGGVPYQYHQAGQQLAALVGKKPVR